MTSENQTVGKISADNEHGVVNGNPIPDSSLTQVHLETVAYATDLGADSGTEDSLTAPNPPACLAPEEGSSASHGTNEAPLQSNSSGEDEEDVVPLSPDDFAKSFLALCRDRIMYCPDLGFHIYNGTHWQRLVRDELLGLICKTILKGTNDRGSDSQGLEDQRRAWSAICASPAKTNALLVLIKQGSLSKALHELDAHPHLVNVNNCTFDIRDRLKLQHDPAHFITKVIPVSYDSEAECPMFEAAVSKIFSNDPDTLRFIQCAFGYLLTGHTTEQSMLTFLGNGSNGKSFLERILFALLGEYAVQASNSLLQHKNDDFVADELILLRGRRLVSFSEIDPAKPINESRMRAMTGNNQLSAKGANGNQVSIIPRFKLLLITNHLPKISGTDHATWRRQRIVPFKTLFWDPDQGQSGPKEFQADKTLADKIIAAELRGILRWALKGCFSWSKNGLPTSAEIRTTTNDVRAESNPVLQFVEECCTVQLGMNKAKKDAYFAYTQWAKRDDLPLLNINEFGKRMKELGYKDGKSGSVRHWKDIRINVT